MKTTNRLITTWIIASALFVLNVFPAFAAEAEYVPGQVIVKFRPGTTQTQMDMANRHAGGHGQKNASGAFKIDLPADDDDDVVSAMMTYANDPAVQYVEPNYIYHAFVTTPNDSFYPAFPYNGGINPGQWNLRTIGADTAWDTWRGSNSVTIAIIDSGVSMTHPDLAAKIVQGYNFVDNDSNPTDQLGHGTHVAGIAAASTNNETGVGGVDWNARIMPVRVLDSGGSGTSDNVAAGIRWAADHGAKVINMSFGGPSDSQTMQNAINYAYGKGVVVVAAAGNTPNGIPFYPASGEHVISVAATNSSDSRASFSNYNAFVDVAAPGYQVLSTYWSEGNGNGYGWGDGTSMAAPHVAGLAALIASYHTSWTSDQIETAIKQSARDLGTTGYDYYYGWGRVNALAAINFSFANRGFIIGLYRDLLDRGDAWDPENENEIAPWVDLVNAGTPRWEVVWRMMSTHEYHRSVVDGFYGDILGRTNKNDGDIGRETWANAMDNGMASRYVRAALTGSDEFYRLIMKFNNSGDYVDFLYQNILDRTADPGTADPGGRAAWVNAINSGGQNRIQVAYNFMCSYEFYGKFITDSYISFLNRPSAQYVQESEINGWRNAMFAGLSEEALLARMYGSDEYFARTSGI